MSSSSPNADGGYSHRNMLALSSSEDEGEKKDAPSSSSDEEDENHHRASSSSAPSFDESAFRAAFDKTYDALCETHESTKPSSFKTICANIHNNNQQTLTETPTEEVPPLNPEADLEYSREYFGRRDALRDVKCYRCGQRGHMRAECTVEVVSTCALCGRKGHLMNSCPDRRCLFCSGTGHIAASCPVARSVRPAERSKNLQCRFCDRNSGHVSLSCPKSALAISPTLIALVACATCGERGHVRCDEIRPRVTKCVSCFNCGSAFHVATRCKMPNESQLMYRLRQSQSASVSASLRSGAFRDRVQRRRADRRTPRNGRKRARSPPRRRPHRRRR